MRTNAHHGLVFVSSDGAVAVLELATVTPRAAWEMKRHLVTQSLSLARPLPLEVSLGPLSAV